VYIKHRATPWYIVVLPMPKRKKFLTPANRFTLTMASLDEVKKAQRELRGQVTELGPIEGRSFLFADLNRNWWEVTC
jgi:hypothetical protein